MNEQPNLGSSAALGGCPFHKPEEVDFMDPQVQEHWFDAYDILRREQPIYYMPQIGMHVVTRYEDLEHILRHPRLFTAGPDVQSTEPLIKHEEARALYDEHGWVRYTALGENLPRHAIYRACVDPVLTFSAVKKYEDFIRGTINELIDEWIDRGADGHSKDGMGEIEFIKDFAEPLPMIVIAKLLGFPRMDLPKLKEWSYAWVMPFARGLTLEQEKWAVSKHIELQHYIFETMKRKRENPEDDIITRLCNIEIDDVDTGERRKLTDTEIIGMTDHLLIGGNETTTFALSNGLWLLFRFPEVYEELQQDRSKIRNFVEEVLRMESPTQGLYRFVTEDTEVGGVKLKKGATLSIRYGAGNHDPEKFPDPETLKLGRRNAGRHLAFGLGEHHCPGATLSRFEQNLAWEILLERVKNMQPVPEKDDFSHVHGMWVRALNQIHMRFEKA